MIEGGVGIVFAWTGVAVAGLGILGCIITIALLEATKPHEERDQRLDDLITSSAWAVVLGAIMVFLPVFF